jgi:Tol biopolymer transport system component
VTRSRLLGSVAVVGGFALIAVVVVVVLTRDASSAGAKREPAVIRVQALRGHIVFARAGGTFGDETIFFAAANGQHQQRLTQPGASCCPRINRQGTRVLFSVSTPDGRITTGTMKPDRSGFRKIRLPDKTINLGPGAWSPDGKRIAFQVWDDQHPRRRGIYIGRASDGGALRRVTTARSSNDLPGDFSRDGRRLVFFRERLDVQSVGSIWVVNVDGTHLKRLTPPRMLAGFGTVRWSPDGSKILFSDAQNLPRGNLWTVRPDGSHLARLFHDSHGRFAISGTWSPDGSLVMFALDPTADEFSHPPNAFYVIKADGTGLRRVIGGQDFKREPDWTR